MLMAGHWSTIKMCHLLVLKHRLEVNNDFQAVGSEQPRKIMNYTTTKSGTFGAWKDPISVCVGPFQSPKVLSVCVKREQRERRILLYARAFLIVYFTLDLTYTCESVITYNKSNCCHIPDPVICFHWDIAVFTACEEQILAASDSIAVCLQDTFIICQDKAIWLLAAVCMYSELVATETCITVHRDKVFPAMFTFWPSMTSTFHAKVSWYSSVVHYAFEKVSELSVLTGTRGESPIRCGGNDS